MKSTNQFEMPFPPEEGGSSKNTSSESVLRVIHSPEDAKNEIARKYNIVVGSPTYERMSERDGQWYVEDEKIEDYDTRMTNLETKDEDSYVHGQL